MNFGTPVPLLLGIFLIVGAVALFFLDRLKPGYQRDYDKVYALLFLLSGIFLIGNLTMDILSSFQQLIMVGTITALMIQNVQSRTPLTDRGGPQPGPGMPPGRDRDGYRPARANRGYSTNTRTSVQAELDRRDIPPDPRYSRPMLSGYDEPARPRSEYDERPRYRSDYPDEPPARSDYSQDRYSDPDPYTDKRTGNDSFDRPESSSEPSSYSDSSYSDSSSYYSSGPRPDSDLRLRRRRPSNSRRDGGDRYRLNPGDPRR